MRRRASVSGERLLVRHCIYVGTTVYVDND